MESKVTQKVSRERPVYPEIGIVTLVPDEWYGPWTTRHYLMNKLAYYFPIVWVEPALGWRESIRHLLQLKGCANLRRGSVQYISVYNPIWFPKLYKPKVIANLIDKIRLVRAAKLLKRKGCKKIILYIWRPEFSQALDLILHDISFYHIDDEYSFSDLEKQIDEGEEALIRRVDQVIIHSKGLLEKKGKYNVNTMFVPNGVDYEAYTKQQPEPSDLRNIPHPRIGYTGVIKKQMDIALVLELARSHRKWSFVFVGPRGNVSGKEALLQELLQQPNVYMLGSRPVAELPAYVQHFDVGMLCYIVNDYTKYIYPLKLHEYLACGLPVVGSPIRTLFDFTDVVTLANGPEEWSVALNKALDKSARSCEIVKLRQAISRQYDWRSHAEKIAQTVCEHLQVESSGAVN